MTFPQPYCEIFFSRDFSQPQIFGFDFSPFLFPYPLFTPVNPPLQRVRFLRKPIPNKNRTIGERTSEEHKTTPVTPLLFLDLFPCPHPCRAISKNLFLPPVHQYIRTLSPLYYQGSGAFYRHLPPILRYHDQLRA